MLLVSYGTRPEWLKLKPIIAKLKQYEINHQVLFTGQHKDIIGSTFDNFILIDKKLDNRLDDITTQILKQVNKKNVFEGISCVLVQGDTASVFAISLAAMHRKIKIIHLEAGLRTYDKDNPYPEEYYRQIVSRLADYHLCPNNNNKTNLNNEKIFNGVFVIGNTVLDNITDVTTSFENKVLITMHRRENLYRINDWFQEVENLANMYPNIEFIIPVHPNPKIQKASKIFKKTVVLDSLPHKDLIGVLKSSKVIITDSGGIQEESSFLRKKCIVCRTTTERSESIDKNSFLCKNPESLSIIFKSIIKDFRVEKNYVCPYGDGNAAEKFINLLKENKIVY